MLILLLDKKDPYLNNIYIILFFQYIMPDNLSMRKYISKSGREYIQTSKGWFRQNGTSPIESLDDGVYVSEPRFKTLIRKYNKIKGSGRGITSDGLRRLIEYGKQENYTGENGRVVAIICNERKREIKHSSTIDNITPSFETEGQEIVFTLVGEESGSA